MSDKPEIPREVPPPTPPSLTFDASASLAKMFNEKSGAETTEKMPDAGTLGKSFDEPRGVEATGVGIRDMPSGTLTEIFNKVQPDGGGEGGGKQRGDGETAPALEPTATISTNETYISPTNKPPHLG